MRKKHSQLVSLYMFRDGEVELLITNGNGSLGLTATLDGPALTVRDTDRNITGQWALTANGRIRGYLIDRHGTYQYIPAQPTRKPARTPAPRRRTGGKQS